MRQLRLRLLRLLASSLLPLAAAAPALGQTGSVLSDMTDPDVQARYRAEAVERIKCPPLPGWDAKMAAFEAAGMHKWDRAAMGCAVAAGTDALDDLSLPASLMWAFFTLRVDNIERHLEVLGANLEYFDVLSKAYSDHYQGIELSSELSVRWERTRARCERILEKIAPIMPKLAEARILRAGFHLASTAREATPEQQSAALAIAVEDLESAIADDPAALDGLGQLMLGQVLLALPEFLGGNALRAIALLEQAHELNPGDLTVRRALTEAYLGEREDGKAIALLASALTSNPALENPQDYVDDTRFLGGLAVRAGRPDLAKQFGEARDRMLAARPELLTRKQTAAFGHGGEDPITGLDTDELN
ncbi:tetratricopeptide repeat protein [Roseobacteraceae bacterium NS-SX3]